MNISNVSLRCDNLYDIIKKIINDLNDNIDINTIIERIVYIYKDKLDDKIVKCSYKCILNANYLKVYVDHDYQTFSMFLSNANLHVSLMNHNINQAIGILLQNDNKGTSYVVIRVLKSKSIDELYMLPCYSFNEQLTFLEQLIINVYIHTSMTYKNANILTSEVPIELKQVLTPTADTNVALKTYISKDTLNGTNFNIYGISEILKHITNVLSIKDSVLYSFNIYTHITGHKCIKDNAIVYINKDNDKYTPNLKLIHIISKEAVEVINSIITSYINNVYTISKVDLRSIAKELNIPINIIIMCHILIVQRRVFFNRHKAVHNALINLFMFNTNDQMYALPLGLFTYDTLEAVLYEEVERLTKENIKQQKIIEDQQKIIEDQQKQLNELNSQQKIIEDQQKQINELNSQQKIIEDQQKIIEDQQKQINELNNQQKIIEDQQKQINELNNKLNMLLLHMK